ncbi:Thiamin pyrophosphokinase, catalytic domain [Pseudoruegeria aquimaris]|uniref:Thiamine diphosphokinase n=2 Tax=Pseudoruegeria aquimaris TaxID=393663 RepID=A0A1Y5RGI7_9RHOB|nr:Thiamin pyrophosphokinase, catalytic domain [Pseudoruegeria aquimaris]
MDNAAVCALLEMAPNLFAADGGGAASARAAGHWPQAVIGDMDSLDAPLRRDLEAAGVALMPVAEQDSTDFEKCLQRLRAPLILCLGFTGGRLDHELAALHALAAFPAQPAILVGARDVIFRVPPALELDLAAGTRVSLFPMGPARGASSGLKWPIDGIDFAPGVRIGTSNCALGPVSLRIARGEMLVILPRRCLPEAARGLRAAHGG